MSTPRPKRDLNSPHAGKSERMRNVKGSYGSTEATTSGIGEAPSSRLKKFGIIFVIAMIILFLVMDFIDRANVKKERERRSQQSGLYIDTNAQHRDEITRLI